MVGELEVESLDQPSQRRRIGMNNTAFSIPLNPLGKAPKIKEDGNHNDQDNDHHQQDIER